MKKLHLPMIIGLCILLFIVITVLSPRFPEYDKGALMVANVVLALLSIGSYLMMQKKVKEERAQAFVNGVYSATLLRLMVCLGSIFIYAYTNRDHLHKPTVFVMMGMYILYSFLETVTMSKAARK
jgi:FtsH-binding integral membrane protein